VGSAGDDVASLIGEMTDVIHSHDAYMAAQIKRNGIDVIHARASFLSDSRIQARCTDGSAAEFTARNFVIATGPKPRRPDNVPIDHESIYDSDSILSLGYLPASLVVLGGGVIASEYAIFAVLGVDVTMIDRSPTPLAFLEPEMVRGFLGAFARYGGRFLGDSPIDRVEFDGISAVHTHLTDGRVVKSDKVLCALGRISQLDGLHVERPGVKVNERQLVEVNAFGQTSAPHIYAAGYVIGPPSLASAAMEQAGAPRATCSASIRVAKGDWMPSGIYSIPEITSVGLTSEQTRALRWNGGRSRAFQRNRPRTHCSLPGRLAENDRVARWRRARRTHHRRQRDRPRPHRTDGPHPSRHGGDVRRERFQFSNLCRVLSRRGAADHRSVERLESARERLN
jgi:NAD(P) transhydrogenase